MHLNSYFETLVGGHGCHKLTKSAQCPATSNFKNLICDNIYIYKASDVSKTHEITKFALTESIWRHLTLINSDDVILRSLRARLGSSKKPAKISAKAVTSPQ